MNAPAIRLADVAFSYGASPPVLALEEVVASPGERVFIKGPSGSTTVAIWRYLAVLFVCALAGAAGIAAQSGDVRTLQWQDLLPADQVALPPPIVDHSAVPFDSYPPNINAPTVPSLDGELVRLPGFVVPLDVTEGKVSSFLLVPYFGACIHQPPPPPNQIVYVSFAAPVELDSMYAPVWVTGRMRIETYSDAFVQAGYALTGREVEPYDY